MRRIGTHNVNGIRAALRRGFASSSSPSGSGSGRGATSSAVPDTARGPTGGVPSTGLETRRSSSAAASTASTIIT